MSYAYLGPAGTFTEMALCALPSTVDRPEPYPTVAAAIAAVRSGHADAAVVPLENSVSGAVPPTLGELAGQAGQLRIDAEVEVPVTFTLMARPGTALPDVTLVRSHPHAYSQCQRWLAGHLPRAQVVPTDSTATAAREVAASGGCAQAAIAAPIAARHYGLVALADGIGERQDAVTRFVSLRPAGDCPEPTGSDRSSFVVTPQQIGPGALAGVLGEFARRRVNLTWIQSWPSGPALGRYHFFVDVDGHISTGAVAAAVEAVRGTGAAVAFLGSYPRARTALQITGAAA